MTFLGQGEEEYTNGNPSTPRYFYFVPTEATLFVRHHPYRTKKGWSQKIENVMKVVSETMDDKTKDKLKYGHTKYIISYLGKLCGICKARSDATSSHCTCVTK